MLRFSAATLFLVLALTAPASARPAVKVGMCGRLDRLEETKAAGYDYAEVGVSEIAALSDEEFEALRVRLRKLQLPTPVANLFIPKTMKIVGPDVDKEAALTYVKKALDRVALLGVRTVVFGSGGSRRVPDGFSRDEAFAQLVAFAKVIAPEAKRRRITIAVEPLRKEESNIINSAAEGLEWVKAVGHPNFQLMVDFYHLASENEDPAILLEAGKAIRHFHIANPKGRAFPFNAAEHDYAPYFANIKKMGYRGGISVEGKTESFKEEAPRALAFLREELAGAPAASAGKRPAATNTTTAPASVPTAVP
jgi:sugar phosphate isomerase/epimerase